MHKTLSSVFTSRSTSPFETRAKIRVSIARFLAAGIGDKTISDDVDEDHLTVSLAASTMAMRLATDQEQLRRVLDLLMGGLRPRR